MKLTAWSLAAVSALSNVASADCRTLPPARSALVFDCDGATIRYVELQGEPPAPPQMLGLGLHTVIPVGYKPKGKEEGRMMGRVFAQTFALKGPKKAAGVAAYYQADNGLRVAACRAEHVSSCDEPLGQFMSFGPPAPPLLGGEPTIGEGCMYDSASRSVVCADSAMQWTDDLPLPLPPPADLQKQTTMALAMTSQAEPSDQRSWPCTVKGREAVCARVTVADTVAMWTTMVDQTDAMTFVSCTTTPSEALPDSCRHVFGEAVDEDGLPPAAEAPSADDEPAPTGEP